jgi:hypothetical protein
MKEIFAHVWETCRRAGLAVGVLPIEVSLVVQPEETRDLAPLSAASTLYGWKLSALRQLARPYVNWKRRPRPLVNSNHGAATGPAYAANMEEGSR